jgi:hypothetical protein
MRGRSFVGLIAVVGLAACGKEIGRVPLRADGSGQTEIQVKAGQKLALWTSLDIKYHGGGYDFDAVYDIDLVQGGASVGKALCNPLDVSVKMNSKEVNILQDRSVKYQGKMRCEITAAKDGPATLKVSLHIRKTPPDLSVTDASLVVKE